jgi:ATP-dependent DNA helicase RecG
VNIEKIIKRGESETVEFKEAFDREAIETVGAFANTKGGIILIGISDKGEVKGLQLGKRTLGDWSNRIFQSTEPAIIPDIKIETVKKKTIGLITIPEFPVKPVSVKGKCYKRLANNNKSLTAKEITELYLYSTGSSWDAFPARDAQVEDIDFNKVARYIDTTKRAGRRKFTETSLQILEKLELIKKGQPTWTAILLFGKEPQRFLEQAKVHCGRFKGEATIIDDNYIGLDLIEQVEDVMACIKKNINVRYEISGKPQREEIWDYPLEALREAVLNAICHRVYAVPADTIIKIYDDYISIWNPGGLPPGITLEDLYNPNHPSKPRNRLIAQIFYDLGEIEQYGSGIQRMINACKNHGIPEPSFEEAFGGFLVIFRKDVYTQEYLQQMGLNERQIKVITYVKENGKITNKKYQQIANTTKKTASRDLMDLVEKGIFQQIGTTGKGTFYTLKKETKGT